MASQRLSQLPAKQRCCSSNQLQALSPHQAPDEKVNPAVRGHFFVCRTLKFLHQPLRQQRLIARLVRWLFFYWQTLIPRTVCGATRDL